ncbi:MAG: segregation/condensation protein A [Synergistaceae bacterium]|jgi:segregation and condensation protein A|nr:segregation/condensation protein A [Synergistaceae bacterium]
METEPVFEITLQDFSGPLDLLCHLVESREIDASRVSLSAVLSQYVTYLLTARKATLAELADFFSLASRILIRKVRSLIPRDSDEPKTEGAPEPEDIFTEAELSDEELAMMLERFKPYRTAAMRLGEMKTAREKSFTRISDDGGGPPWFDIGDLYSLSTLWWNTIEEYSRQRTRSARDGFMDEIPDAVPQEIQVDNRMEEIRSLMAASPRTTLSMLLGHFGTEALIVTLLALLELSRLGGIDISQDSEWGDIAIETAG